MNLLILPFAIFSIISGGFPEFKSSALIISISLFFEIGYPILFFQKRIGLSGREFKIIKFRTMTNEKDKLGELLPDFKRITRIGKLIRKSSLDELPSLINVLIGNMSIVGPRPHPINLNRQFKNQIGSFNKRHRFKPGITGLAQSMGYSGFIGSVQDMSDRVKMDVFYFKNWSLLLDFKIMFKTIGILFNGIFKRA